MTPYRSPHHDTLSFNRHSEWRQEYFVRKQESGNMTWSEESMTLMTPYRLLHHGNSPSHSFRITLNVSLIMTADPSHSLRMTPCHERRFHQQMKKLSEIRLSPSDSFLLSHISLPVPVFRIASSLFKICFSSSSPKKRPTGSPLSLKPCMVTSVPV